MAILQYIGRRLLMLIPVLLGISLAAFLLGRIAPGDPVDDALFRIGNEIPTEEDRAAIAAADAATLSLKEDRKVKVAEITGEGATE